MQHAKFSIGQIIHHQRFDYRGVIFDVDPVFSGTDEWYENVAKSRPPKNEPWYHVLVDNAQHNTYVAERNLEAADSILPIHHPLIKLYFDNFVDGRYFPINSNN
ncbi:MAG: heat shock protein HspQ [Proteobacteria bacterium]|nr:heat shock protein HspQ [Pseudomonadota bacterium]